jgi:hypothetical protein
MVFDRYVSKERVLMTTQLYLARGIVEGRVHTEQDHALVRTVELARHAERRAARMRRSAR